MCIIYKENKLHYYIRLKYLLCFIGILCKNSYRKVRMFTFKIPIRIKITIIKVNDVLEKRSYKKSITNTYKTYSKYFPNPSKMFTNAKNHTIQTYCF